MSNPQTTRAAQLREELNYHIYRYNVLGSPVITDGEYDQLYHELRQLEEMHPELIRDAPRTHHAGFAHPASRK